MIYFIQDRGNLNIKIGYAKIVDERLRSLTTGNSHGFDILLVVRGEREMETELHQRFAEHRVVGEWFRPSALLIKYIAEAYREKILLKLPEECVPDVGVQFLEQKEREDLGEKALRMIEMAYRRGFQHMAWVALQAVRQFGNRSEKVLDEACGLAAEWREYWSDDHPQWMQEFCAKLKIKRDN